jgi:hypothetical protein
MANINWRSDKPDSKDKVKDLPGIIRSQKSSLDAALQQTMYWSDSVASGGVIRPSTTTPGTARLGYGLRSAVSDPGFNATGMIVSDESRVVVFDSGQSCVIGGDRVSVNRLYEVGDADSWISNSRVLVQASAVTDFILGVPVNTKKITFDTAYSAPPTIQLTSSDTDGKSCASYTVSVASESPNASHFTIWVSYLHAGSDPNASLVYWRSVGTVDL